MLIWLLTVKENKIVYIKNISISNLILYLISYLTAKCYLKVETVYWILIIRLFFLKIFLTWSSLEMLSKYLFYSPSPLHSLHVCVFL